MKTIDLVAAILVIIGALNWGLVGLFDFNLVHFVLGTTVITRVVYILVGLSGLFLAGKWLMSQNLLPHTPHPA